MTLTELDTELTACAKRMRRSEHAGDAEAWFNDAAEMDRLLDQRHEATRDAPTP